jgi:hypothetical protein
LRQQVTVKRMIGVVEKRLLPPVATSRDVIGNAGDDESRKACPWGRVDAYRVISKLALNSSGPDAGQLPPSRWQSFMPDQMPASHGGKTLNLTVVTSRFTA